MLSTNNNLMAINVGRSITRSQNMSASAVAKLGSGHRIGKASDDAAGVSISEGMRSELVQLDQNVRNAETASDLLQVAEAPLNEASQILLRMREMAVAAANSHLQDSQRDILNSELNQLRVGIDRMLEATRYNNDALLAGQPAVSGQISTAITDKIDTGVTKVQLSGADTGNYTFGDSNQDNTITLGNGVVSQTLDLSTPLDNGRVATGTKLVANFDHLGIQVTLSGAGFPSEGRICRRRSRRQDAGGGTREEQAFPDRPNQRRPETTVIRATRSKDPRGRPGSGFDFYQQSAGRA